MDTTNKKYMENKIKYLNDNIKYLVKMYVNTLASYNRGNCLRIVLLNKDRHCCSSISCDDCNRKSLATLEKALLDNYTLK